MNLLQFTSGIKILQQYYDNPGGYHLEASHDTIHLDPTDRPLTPEHVREMLDLGWWQPDQVEEDYEYDPESGWNAFT